MKRYITLLACLIIWMSGCRTETEEIVKPQPIWKLRSDIFLSNKILLGAHATDKRLVVADTRGFFQMDAADTSFVRYIDGVGTLTRFGGFGITNSLFGPVLSNTLYVGLANDRNEIAIVDIASTLDSTKYYSEYNGGGGINIPRETGMGNALVNTTNPKFGAYNESTKTLLYTVFDSKSGSESDKWTILMNKKENSPYFSFRRSFSDSYRTNVIGKFQSAASIAVADHFIVTPRINFSSDDTYVYAIGAKTGSITKIPVNFSPPTTYFLFKGHLYGHSSNSNDLARSDDGGFTWRKIGSLSVPLNFAVVNENLIGYGLSQIFWIDNGTETFSNPRELINTGLDLSQITGVAGFNNKVFAATLSGLYAIDTKDFFTMKQKI